MTKYLFDDKTECCGCEACANVCPTKIIEMREDEEGFVYPYIIDEDKCIDCKQCEKVCPVKNVNKVKDFSEMAFAGYSEIETDVKLSSSGGLANDLYREFIKSGGVVYGVAYTGDDCKKIEYIRAERLEEIEKFRGSKYAQSEKKDIYKIIQCDLRKHLKVLFIGLPCEVNALKLFLSKEYENLYTCALICHGPTSIEAHRAYIDKIKNIYQKNVMSFSVRYKKDGWKPYYIKADFDDGNTHLEKFNESCYGKCFKFLKRPSCNNCQIKRGFINSDITIGDYHNATRENMKKYNEYGISSAIVHTIKGNKMICELDKFYLEKIDVQSASKNKAYNIATKQYRNRKEFGKVFSEKGINAACNLYSCKKIEQQEIFEIKIIKNLAKIKNLILK